MKVVAAFAVVLLLVVVFPSGTATGGPVAGRLALMGSGPNFNVTFIESGLPGGTSWTVTFNGSPNSSLTNSIGFVVASGSYSYTVTPIPGYHADAYSGTVTVGGMDKTIMVTWTVFTYPVTFTEAGLLSGTSWSITLNSMMQSSATTTIVFAEPNGTWAYTVGPVPGFHANAYSGSVHVAGGPSGVTVAWSVFVWQVSFDQTGLPGGILWWVNITNTGQSFSGTGASIKFTEPNGSYTFTVQTGNPGYAPSPSSGPLTVSGAPVTQTVMFNAIAFTVTFNEANLPAGTSWWVNITSPAPQSFFGTGSTISFLEPDGTYQYKIASGNKSWAPTPSHGSFIVSGGPPSPVSITFNLVTFGISFKETGLPSFTQWSVTLSGVLTSSKTPWVNFTGTNGTHFYSVSIISGYHANVYNGSVTVNGKSPPTVTIAWTQVVYTLYFNVTGYPLGKNWSISVASVLQTTSGSSISFPNEPNATYTWSLHNWTRVWQPNVTSGSIRVAGGNVLTRIGFTLVTYPVYFAESGLPSQANWSVNLNGTVQWSTLPLMSFPEPNGTYNYTVSTVNGYVPFPPGGTVHVTGGPRTINIQYQPFASAVTFQEAGLAFNKSWAVTVDGVRHSSNTSAIVFNLGNGSYSFIVGAVRGYTVLPSAGSFTVAGLPINIPVNFSGVPFEVIFLPSGLLPQANWSVTFAGMTGFGDGAHYIYFNISNGTYPFSVGFSAFYRAYNATPYWFTSATSGNVTVNGHTVQETISYLHVPEYPVTFYEHGLNLGTGWSVVLGSSIVWSTSSSLTILEPNGTYSYYLGIVLGYSVTFRSGVVSVNAGALSVNLTYIPLVSLDHNQTCFRFCIPWTWVLIGGLAVAAAALSTLALVLRRRSKR